jgi:hypothetical protein
VAAVYLEETNVVKPFLGFLTLPFSLRERQAAPPDHHLLV